MSKLPFIKQDDLLLVKKNLAAVKDKFKEENSSWLEAEFGHPILTDSKYNIPEIVLSVNPDDVAGSDAKNAQLLYTSLDFLTDSQASDERLWAGLCMGPLWKYVQERWNIKEQCTEKNILQHYFFAYYSRRSFTRNAAARLWWTARLTYEPDAEDKWELTKYVLQYSRYVGDFLERNISNGGHILHPFLHALIDAEHEGISLTTLDMRKLTIYLDELGGVYILDCVSEKKIHDNILKKAREIGQKKS